MRIKRQITVNQIGYPIDSQKMAVCSKKYDHFEVLDQKTKETVYQGNLSEAIDDQDSGEIVYLADFSKFTKVGEYQIKAGNDNSSPFVISENPYAKARQGILKAFYYYRCGIELPEKYAGK